MKINYRIGIAAMLGTVLVTGMGATAAQAAEPAQPQHCNVQGGPQGQWTGSISSFTLTIPEGCENPTVNISVTNNSGEVANFNHEDATVSGCAQSATFERRDQALAAGWNQNDPRNVSYSLPTFNCLGSGPFTFSITSSDGTSAWMTVSGSGTVIVPPAPEPTVPPTTVAPEPPATTPVTTTPASEPAPTTVAPIPERESEPVVPPAAAPTTTVGSALPATGPSDSTVWLALLAFAALMAGGAAVHVSRRPVS